MATDPFWLKVGEAYDQVLRHPETELTIEYSDKRGTVWAKKDPDTGLLKVSVEVEFVGNVKVG